MLFGGTPANDPMHLSKWTDDDDIIFGRFGNDTIAGHGGVDFMDGEGGVDTISYAYSSGGGQIDLLDATAESLSGPTVETIRGFENVWGSQGNDRIYGTNGANDLEGEAGNDTIVGRGGNDTLEGENGNDSLLGGDGNDSVLGSSGHDTLNGGSGNDELVGGPGIDRFVGGAGSDDFVFTSTSESPGSSTDILLYDTIVGFDGVGAWIGGPVPQDVIDLSAIDANTGASGNQKFAFLGDLPAGASVTTAARLWVTEVGSDTYLSGNTDGDSARELVIRIVDGDTRAWQYIAQNLPTIDSDFVL